MLSKKNNGITLVALVITIVILLILAGISISTLTNTGIFQKAKDAKKASENAEKEQEKTLSEYEKELNKYSSKELTAETANIVLSKTENVELHDKNGNKIVVPAGFKVVVNDDTNNALTVDKGIVVEDGKGNQYVWIPCTTEGSKSQLQFKRTEWEVEDDNGTRASKDELTLICSEDYNNNGLTYAIVNEIVSQVKKEKESVNKNGGYYIGRYEVGDEDGIAVIKSNKIPKADIDINWIAAYTMAKGIGGGIGSTTYLCSSYAWDTAINFIQNNGFPNYAKAREDSYNENWGDKEVTYNVGTKPAGTEQRLLTGQTTAKCNIFDMGGNTSEFTTEVIPDSSETVVMRGGVYYDYNYPAGFRGDNTTAVAFDGGGFRATLFLN